MFGNWDDGATWNDAAFWDVAPSTTFTIDVLSLPITFGDTNRLVAIPFVASGFSLPAEPGPVAFRVSVALTALDSTVVFGTIGFRLSVPIAPLEMPIVGGDTQSSRIDFSIDPLELSIQMGDTGYSLNRIWSVDPLVVSVAPGDSYIGVNPARFDGFEMPITMGSVTFRLGQVFEISPLSLPVSFPQFNNNVGFRISPLVLNVRFAVPVSKRLTVNEITKINIASLFTDGTLLFPLDMIEGDAFGAIIVVENASNFGLGFDPESYAIPTNTTLGNLRLENQGDYIVFRYIGGMVCVTDQFMGV